MLKWHKQVISTVAEFLEHWTGTPVAAAFDTEADGLHLIDSRPFVFQFGWVSEDGQGFAFAVDMTADTDWRDIITAWHNLVKTVPVYLGHNVKFDLHMLANIDMPYTEDNISDTQIHIRLAHDNVPVDRGGITLKLKEYAAQYITITAKDHDKAIQYQRQQIAKEYNLKLKQAMGWTLGKLDLFFKDSLNEASDLPTMNDYVNYMRWYNDLPLTIRRVMHGRVTKDDIPYTMVDRALLLTYALDDIVYTLETWSLTKPTLVARMNEEALAFENSIIYDCYNMERVGFTLDKQYVKESKHRMKEYMLIRRQQLKDMAGMDITANQHAQIAKLIEAAGLQAEGTGTEVLQLLIAQNPDNPIIPLLETVMELRTLEKWYGTYLLRFDGESKIYTQLNQVGAASLRFTSDFQQFPKKGLYTKDKQELFNPRRAIIVPKSEGYDAIVYYDYSQIELRGQALYTILLGEPDLNLCRAYMPYKCVNKEGVEFDYNNKDHISTSYTDQWFYLDEPDVPWTPTDVHSATTRAAFDIDEHHPDFSALRSMGKRVNFAKNYGAQQGRIEKMFPDKELAIIKQIDQGYYKAFPGIEVYQSFCYRLAREQPYATNFFGFKYWGVSGHNLINMLIQGGCATFLKDRLRAACSYLRSVGAKSVPQMNIHDEISFLRWPGEQHYLDEVQRIMGITDDWPIPIVADGEITYTNWADKEDIK